MIRLVITKFELMNGPEELNFKEIELDDKTANLLNEMCKLGIYPKVRIVELDILDDTATKVQTIN